jgi:hypothetical protein
MKVILVDAGSGIADAAAAAWPEMEVLRVASLADVPSGSGTAFVCPSDSRLMDMGVYSTVMFPGLETLARAALSRGGVPDRVGGKYLPIGQAMKVGDVIFSPTMLKPQDVSGTRNAFLAMNAALWCASRHDVETLVVPGMCIGAGKMSAEEAVLQMKRGHDLHACGNHHGVYASDVLEEQPKLYENTEFIDIPDCAA